MTNIHSPQRILPDETYDAYKDCRRFSAQIVDQITHPEGRIPKQLPFKFFSNPLRKLLGMESNEAMFQRLADEQERINALLPNGQSPIQALESQNNESSGSDGETKDNSPGM